MRLSLERVRLLSHSLRLRIYILQLRSLRRRAMTAHITRPPLERNRNALEAFSPASALRDMFGRWARLAPLVSMRGPSTHVAAPFGSCPSHGVALSLMGDGKRVCRYGDIEGK